MKTTLDRTPLAFLTRACLASPGGRRVMLIANITAMLGLIDSRRIIVWCYAMSLGRVSEN